MTDSYSLDSEDPADLAIATIYYMDEHPDEFEVRSMKASVSWENLKVSDVILAELSFHESAIRDRFTFTPNMDRIGGGDERATSPRSLGGYIADFARSFRNDLQPHWEFSKLNAASISGTGNLTDFEFVYEGTMRRDAVKRARRNVDISSRDLDRRFPAGGN